MSGSRAGEAAGGCGCLAAALAPCRRRTQHAVHVVLAGVAARHGIKHYVDEHPLAVAAREGRARRGASRGVGVVELQRGRRRVPGAGAVAARGRGVSGKPDACAAVRALPRPSIPAPQARLYTSKACSRYSRAASYPPAWPRRAASRCACSSRSGLCCRHCSGRGGGREARGREGMGRLRVLPTGRHAGTAPLPRLSRAVPTRAPPATLHRHVPTPGRCNRR